jgi:hypothetical protein
VACSPVRHSYAAQAVGDQKDGRFCRFYGVLNRIDPFFTLWTLPVPLFDSAKIRILALPKGLPMSRSGTIPAWDCQKGPGFKIVFWFSPGGLPVYH